MTGATRHRRFETPDVLVVIAGWQARALLRAQLIEEGLDVKALDRWEEASLLLGAQLLRPGVVVVDAEDQPDAPGVLAQLRDLFPPARAVILASALGAAEARARALGYSHVLVRPHTIGDIVSLVRRLLPS